MKVGNNTEKECSKCKIIKPISSYYISNGNTRGECKPCGEIMRKERLLQPKKEKKVRIVVEKPKKEVKVKKPKKETESIFETVVKLKKKAKDISKSNTHTESWKLENGWSWITEEVPFTKTTTRKQRVLRKIK